MPQRYEIVTTSSATSDLAHNHAWIEQADGTGRADNVLAAVIDAIASLERHPQRGSLLEAERAGLSYEYRQIRKRRFRIIYRIDLHKVVVVAILHERRDINAAFRARQIPDEPIT